MPGAIKTFQNIHYFFLDQELLHHCFITLYLLHLPHHFGCICPWCIRDKLGRHVPLSTVALGADHPIERLLAIPGYKPLYNCCVLAFSLQITFQLSSVHLLLDILNRGKRYAKVYAVIF